MLEFCERAFWKKKKGIIVFAAVAMLLFLVFRFVLPLMYPFVLGGLIAAVLYPAIRFLHHKFHIGKGVGALVLLTILALLVVIVFGICGYSLIEKGYELFCDYEMYRKVIEQRAGVCCDWIEQQLHLQKGYLMREMKGGMVRMSGNWQEKVMPGIFEGSVSGVKTMFSVGAFFVFTFLSAILIVKEWDEAKEGIFSSYKKYINKVLEFMKIFLGAQIKIIAVIALICFVGYRICGIKSAFSLALITAFMDVLPFIGTGIIIVPLLLWQVVNTHYYRAFLLLSIYICCIIAREYLEPKFISVKAGISPILTLLGIYIGMKIAGFSGIFLGPLYVILLQIFFKELVADSSANMEKDTHYE